MNQYLKATLIVLTIVGVLFIGVPAVLFSVMWHDMWNAADHSIHDHR